jgi:hypothetical protein
MVPGAGIARDGLPGCHFPLDSAFPAAGQGFERPPLFGRSPVPGELIGPVPGVGRPRMPGVPGGPWPGSQPPTEGARYGQPRLVARPTPTLPPDPAQVLIPQAIPADVVLAAPEHHYPAFNVNRTNGLEPWLRFLPVLILGGAGAIGSAFRKPPDRSRGAP